MYSVVLLMAMTSGGDIADCHRGGGRRGGCHGCYGGGCYGGGCYGGGGYGGGCYGGGYGGCYGGGCGGGVIIMRGTGEKGTTGDKKDGKDGKEEEVAAPATIVVSLPADAKLMVDGKPTSSTSETRTFVSPRLDPSKIYYYTLKAEIVRDGQTLVLEKRVDIQAGRESRVTFDQATMVASAK
jgi:uncharacterized protein (TIGR03000 family)